MKANGFPIGVLWQNANNIVMDIERILSLQAIFGKTPDGRYIGKSLIPVINSLMSDPEIKSKTMIQCRNCYLVLSEEYFVDGCKNCNSKEFEIIDANNVGKVKKKLEK